MKEKVHMSKHESICPETKKGFVKIHIEDKEFVFTSEEYGHIERLASHHIMIDFYSQLTDIVAEKKNFIDLIKKDGNLDHVYNLLIWFHRKMDHLLYEKTKEFEQ